MNKERMLQLADFMEKSPRKFSMNTWLFIGSDEITHVSEAEDALDYADPCGTSCCIAGEAFILSRDVEEFNRSDINCIANVASEFLELTKEEESGLFFTDGWPKSFGDRFYKAYMDQEERRKIAVEYIRHLAQ